MFNLAVGTGLRFLITLPSANPVLVNAVMAVLASGSTGPLLMPCLGLPASGYAPGLASSLLSGFAVARFAYAFIPVAMLRLLLVLACFLEGFPHISAIFARAVLSRLDRGVFLGHSHSAICSSFSTLSGGS